MPADGRFVVILGAALIAYNSVAHLTPAYDVVYVPLNLAAAAVILVAARRRGLGAEELGAERPALPAGVRWGAAAAVVAAAGLAVAVAVPGLHGLLDDARVADIGLAVLAYRTLVRIPLGTVILEEVAFRGVLLGAWARWQGTAAAVVGSSVVFGFWHVRPAIELLNENDLAGSLVLRVPAVGALVAFTAGAGVLFCLLRLRSRSLAAPLLAHAAINSLATLAAFMVRPN